MRVLEVSVLTRSVQQNCGWAARAGIAVQLVKDVVAWRVHMLIAFAPVGQAPGPIEPAEPSLNLAQHDRQ